MRRPKELARKDPDARRQAILAAGLAVFAAQGFAATKLDDVAAKAKVAKGTIYLHFKDKQELFEEIVRTAVVPLIARLEGAAALADVSAARALDLLFAVFRQEVLATDRKHVLRLVISEGPRFPKLATFYYREVVSRGLKVIAELLRRANVNGELASDGLAQFPQLVFAPLLLALIWDSLFGRLEPLDVERLLGVHRQLLLGGERGGRS
jgi:AcrR family transcriptional regulator